MANDNRIPELKQILGAMILGAGRPLTVRDMLKCLAETSATWGEETSAFARAKESDVLPALDELRRGVEQAKAGFALAEVAGGFRFESDALCGKWMKQLLDADRPNRLSHPALETLAIIAYRQPISRADIEAVRGVTVDHIVRTLMEMQLIRITGRSELAGRPFLYGTTQLFLEHFGLKSLDELKNIEPILLVSRERPGAATLPDAPASEAPAQAAETEAGEPPTEPLVSSEDPSAAPAEETPEEAVTEPVDEDEEDSSDEEDDDEFDEEEDDEDSDEEDDR